MSIILTIFAILVATVARPTRASCPKGWHVSEARGGWYGCVTDYTLPDTCGRRTCIVDDPNELKYKSRIYCDADVLTLQDGRSVRCGRKISARRAH